MEQSELESCCYTPVCENSVVVTKILKKIKEMSKNVTIEADLSQVFNEFMRKLNENDRYLEYGICNTNFAEAALFLQNTTDLYGKKVDLLWDIIIDYQKRIVSYEKHEEKQEQLKKIEERRNKYKRKRKTNETNQQNNFVNNYSFVGTQSEICDYVNNFQYEQHNLINKWRQFNRENVREESVDIKNNNALFLPSDHIYNLDDNEFVGVYDQFHSFSLPQLFCPSSRKLHQEHVKIPFSDVTNGDKGDLAKCFVRLEKLPNEPTGKLRKYSTADSLLDKSTISDDYSSECDATSSGEMQRNTTALSQDSAFFDCETDGSNQNITESASVVNTDLCCGSSSIVIPKYKKLKLDLPPKESKKEKINQQYLKNKKKISKKILKLCEGISSDYWKFEKFYRRGYKNSEGEGNPASDIESDCDENDNGEEAIPENNNFISAVEIETETVINGMECEEVNNLNTSDYNSDFNIDLNEAESIEENASTTEPVTTSLKEIRNEERSRKNVIEWRKFILPKLKECEKATDFDMHCYGTSLIESTQNFENVYFKDIVKGKSANEIARYFTATLHLINAGNLDILGGKCNGNETSNDSLKLKLLNDKLHHETLMDYQAPSEESFNERLQRVQELNPTIKLHSTPFSSPVAKKRKLMYVKKKKISFSD